MADEFGDAASEPIGSGNKRATGRQAFVQCLADGHLDLLGGRSGAGRPCASLDARGPSTFDRIWGKQMGNGENIGLGLMPQEEDIWSTWRW